MRILRATAALLLGVAAAVSVPTSASAVTGASISLSPTHGPAATTLTATYRYSDWQQGFHVCFTEDINFRWSGVNLGWAPLTWDKPAAQCVARLSEKLPSGLTTRPGAYAVSVLGDNATSATFTLEPTPPPAKTPTPHPHTTTAHAAPPAARPTPTTALSPTLSPTTPPPTPSPTAVLSSATVSPTPSTQLLLASGTAPASPAGLPPWLLGVIGLLAVATGATGYFLRRRTLQAAAAPAYGTSSAPTSAAASEAAVEPAAVPPAAVPLYAADAAPVSTTPSTDATGESAPNAGPPTDTAEDSTIEL